MNNIRRVYAGVRYEKPRELSIVNEVPIREALFYRPTVDINCVAGLDIDPKSNDINMNSTKYFDMSLLAA